MSYEDTLARIESAAARVERDPRRVTLVAVSKTKTVDEILSVYDLGHRDFGENRADEMAAKASQLPSDIRWHYVGALQSNKARQVRPVTHLLHSVDRLSLAKAWLKGPGPPPSILVQVNLGEEPQKSGVAPAAAGKLIGQLVLLGLDVSGLMALPPIPDEPEASRPHFAALRGLREELIGDHPGLQHLSMGMTDDFEVAVEEGASIIRVGRAIFGPRT